MGYDYQIAQEVLTETDKNRILAVYLACEPSALNGVCNWQNASDSFGSASVESFKKTLGNALKKVEAKGGKTATTDDGAAASPEKKEKKASTPRKRKTKAEADGDDAEPKAKKGRGRKKKEESAPAEDDEGAVKNEAGDDE